ncbi:MAG: response regulator [Desulfobacter sp.]
MISILLVDDQATILELGTQILKSLGYSVVPCLGSVKALEVFQKHPRAFDLVITDFMMPEMKGNRLAAEIRFIRTDVPIILCTGHGSFPKAAIHEWGFDGFILKPYEIKDIACLIKQLVRQPSTPRKVGIGA